jgi:uncharacterized YccA/Bax inhibitor family protein
MPITNKIGHTLWEKKHMSMLQSNNPAFGTFKQYGEEQIARSESNTMTIGGTVSATFILLAIVTAVGMFTWNNLMSGGFMTGLVYPIGIGAFIIGIGVSMIIYSKPTTARFIAPIHAVLEGLFVGVMSYQIPLYIPASRGESVTSGSMQTLIIQAVLATFAVTAAMLLGYATGILRLGAFMKKVIITAGLGLVLYVGAIYLGRAFGLGIWDGFWDSGPIGIAFTGFCVVLGSLFLLLDFDFIDKGVQSGAPKHMEWVGAWGLMVTLVWLYIQLLRLLTKLQSRD